MIRKMVAAMMLFLALSVAAANLSATFTLTDIMAYTFSGTGRSAAHYVEADFGSTAHTEAWTWTITTDTDEPVTLLIMEIPTMSTATTATIFNGAFVGGTYTPASVAGGSATLGYTTPSLSGTHRFMCWVQLTQAIGQFPANVTVSVDNGTNTATATTGGGAAWDVYSALTNQGASGSSTADTLYQPNTMRCWTDLAVGTDSIAYDVDIDHGATATAVNLGLYGSLSGGTGSGDVEVSLYDMTGDGGQSAVIGHTLSGPVASAAEDAGTFQTPARTGVHKYRVVVTGGTGFTATPTIFTQLVWDSISPFSASQPPINYSSPVSITPGGTTINATTTLTASGGSGTPTYNWTIVGTPPTGVSLSAATGTNVDLVISGSPTGAVTVRVENGTTGEWSEETYTLGGGGPIPTIDIQTMTVPDGVEQIAYSTTITATESNTTAPYAWSLSGAPVWLSISGTTLSATLSGTPPVGAATGGPFTFDIIVTDSSTATDTQSVTLTINPAGTLVITTGSLTAGTVSTAYSTTMAASGGTAPYTWSATGLPAGLTIDVNTGVISGTPTAAVSATVDVTVIDNVAASDTRQYMLDITAAGGGVVIGGGGGGGGCAASTTGMTWLALLGLLAVAFVGLRRTREE